MAEIKTKHTIIAIIYTIFSLLLYSSSDKASVELYPIVVYTGLVVFIFQLVALTRIAGTFLTAANLFLLSFYIFQNGQFLLLSMGVEFRSFMIDSLMNRVDAAAVFSSISNVLMGLAAITMAKTPQIYSVELQHSRISDLPQRSVYSAVKIGLIVCTIVAIPLAFLKLQVALTQGGVMAVHEYESKIPSLISIFSYMFFPFSCFFLLIETNKTRNNICFWIAILWSAILTICGERSGGFAGVLTLFLLRYFNGYQRRYSSKKAIRIMALVGVIIVVLTPIIAITRVEGDLASVSETNFLVSFVSELGGSCFPLMFVMDIVPSHEPYFYGSAYLTSVIGGLFPSSLDFLGFLKTINEHSLLVETWQFKYLDYTFGIGFSLNAEAYANFGWFGLLAIYGFGLIIFYFLKTCSISIIRDPWQIYKICILLYFWFTLPRRQTYFIWNSLFYGVILMYIYLQILCPNRIKNERI